MVFYLAYCTQAYTCGPCTPKHTPVISACTLATLPHSSQGGRNIPNEYIHPLINVGEQTAHFSQQPTTFLLDKLSIKK